jgi:hypothetical protein
MMARQFGVSKMHIPAFSYNKLTEHSQQANLGWNRAI